MAITALYPINLLSHDDHPDWKVQRFPFTDVGPEVLAKMWPGFLVKFDATAQAVLPALAADDALLGGILLDIGCWDMANPTDRTVTVALSGSFNKRAIHYANAWAESVPSALSPAAIQRLRSLEIFLDPSVPSGDGPVPTGPDGPVTDPGGPEKLSSGALTIAAALFSGRCYPA